MVQKPSAQASLDIRNLKALVSRTLSEISPLRDVILMEPDELSVADFLAKSPIRLRLLRFEGKIFRDPYD